MSTITQELVRTAAQRWLSYRRGLQHLRDWGRMAPLASIVRVAEHRAAARACVRILRRRLGRRERRQAARLFSLTIHRPTA